MIKDNHTDSDSLELRVTGDGSHTLYVPALDEHYHSHFGALTESKHIFIDAGLASLTSKKVSILEVGFGTGLNALLTAMHASDNQVTIHYVTLEKYPLDPSLLFRLNYPAITGTGGRELFEAIHNAPVGETGEADTVVYPGKENDGPYINECRRSLRPGLF